MEDSTASDTMDLSLADREFALMISDPEIFHDLDKAKSWARHYLHSWFFGSNTYLRQDEWTFYIFSPVSDCYVCEISLPSWPGAIQGSPRSSPALAVIHAVLQMTE